MFVVYDRATSAIVKITRYRPYRVTSSYKTMAAARAAVTRMSKAAHANLDTYTLDTDPQFIYGIAESDHYHDNIEKQVTKTGICPGTGKTITVTESVNTPYYLSPLSESYWSA